MSNETGPKPKVQPVPQSVAQPVTTRGGLTENIAVATAVLPKAAVATVPYVAIASRPTVTAVPATAAGFDRTVATTLGK